MRTCIIDIETNGIDNPDKIWCVVLKDVETEEVFKFSESEVYDSFPAWFRSNIQALVGHNIIAYDAVWLTNLLGLELDQSKYLDTLILSQLLNYRIEGGHSLEAWAERLGTFLKVLVEDFSKFTPKLLERCTTDVEINYKLYKFLQGRLNPRYFARAIDIEHRMAFICREMHDTGFYFDIDKANELHMSLEMALKELDEEIIKAFPPKLRFVREYNPRLTKHGTISKTSVPRGWTDLTIVSVDSPFSLVIPEEFNPGSPSQIIERLNEAGWEPTDKTDGHLEAEKKKDKEKLKKFKLTGWKINEVNLATLPDTAPPAARLLVKRLLLAARVRTLNEWKSFYRPDTHRIHGRFYSIGTWPHRMAHRNPNLGNVATEKSIKYNTPELKDLATSLGATMRRLWVASPNAYLVGTDMDSAHLRIFGHIIGDAQFISSVVKGSRKDGTDVHSLNKHKLGEACADRDRAKTFIYSFLNGAGVGKVASIFGTVQAVARASLDSFIDSYPGLKKFRRLTAPAAAERGFFEGIDGRLIANDSAHHMLSGMMLNYESTLMKYANVLWRKSCDARGIKYKQVNLVHDEFVTEVYSYDDAVRVGELQAAAIKLVGERLGLTCPLAGTYKIGKNWLEVH